MFERRLKSVVGMGIGAGAYILTRFAVSFPLPLFIRLNNYEF